ncbi:MAG: GNAT family N-acetyltransferase [Butyricicoccus sp.]|nr:GNAT family N-acetyltransferase [Butyricicoccus pullicaecorum]MDY5972180.1 GNAT family N-acetyltransferase [Butyricicoccus sp.]
MEVWIRPGDPARLEDYVDVMRDSALFDHYYAPDESVLRGVLTDALARGALLTAENSSGEAVGLMQCDWYGMFGAWPYLALLGVKKGWRGMGVGHKLLAAFERVSREMGARQMFICVSGFNPRARALYTSQGYRRVAQIPALYRDDVTENVLMKRLDG